MRCRCVQTCPSSPSASSRQGRESLPLPSAGSHPPRQGGLSPPGSTARFEDLYRKKPKPALFARQKRLRRSPGGPGGGTGGTAQAPAHRAEAEPAPRPRLTTLERRFLREGDLRAYTRAEKELWFQCRCAGTGKKIKSHLCQQAGGHRHMGERTVQPPGPPGLPQGRSPPPGSRRGGKEGRWGRGGSGVAVKEGGAWRVQVPSR